jgi:methyl-accepting chemotaxis protein
LIRPVEHRGETEYYPLYAAVTEQVSAAAQESSAATAQVTATSNELAGYAAELDRLVGAFSV